MLTPKTATTLLATLALAALTRAVPVDPDYVAPPAPLDPNSDLNLNGIPDWYEPEAYVTPDHLAGFLLDHGAKQFAQGYPAPQPQPNYYAKRDAEADPNWGKGGGFVPYFPQPQPQPQPPFVIPVPQPQPFPVPIPGPGTGPSVCSGNNAVAACCRGDSAGCSVVPQNTISGLLGLGIGASALNQACSANQNINCCQQNNNGFLGLNTCGPLIDIF